MYPLRIDNIDYSILNDIPNMTEENKELCKDLCKVGLCISCFCGIYLIFFLRVIHEELNISNMTYF